MKFLEESLKIPAGRRRLQKRNARRRQGILTGSESRWNNDD
jgi:hypothetical protein